MKQCGGKGALYLILYCVVFTSVGFASTQPTQENWQLVNTTRLKGLPYLTSGEGLATDGESFYFNGRLFVTRTDFNYNVIPPFLETGVIPKELLLQGYDHLGDGEIFEGIYYGGLERERVLLNASLITFNATTMLPISYHITQQDHMPWVAVDGDRRLIYTSEWDPVPYFYIYNLDLTFVGAQKIENFNMSSPQGGAFYKGNLYVSCNDDFIHVFNVTADSAYLIQSIPTTLDDEIEGITFVDLSGNDQGLLHLINGNILRPFDHESKHELYHFDIV